MAITTEPINIEKAVINTDSNLELKFVTTKKDSSAITITDYEPLRIAVDNQNSFICKNEESEASIKFTPLTYTSSGTTTVQYTVNSTYDLSMSAFSPELDLLFVFIYSDNATDNDYLEAVVPVYDENALYDRIYNVLKTDFNGCANRCSNVTSSTNVINMYNGFRLALNTGDYKGAINFWNKLNNLTASTTSGCNCH